MSQEKDSLAISMNMAFDGISPDMVRGIITDYTIAKSKLKKLNLKLSIKEIDKIALIMLSVLSEHQYSNNVEWIAQTLKNSNHEIMSKIQEELKINFPIQLCDSTIDVYSMIMHKPHSIMCKPSIEKFTNTNIMLLAYGTIKAALDTLFNRKLTREEYQLIAQSWFYYASLAQDASNPDNKFKEQIKELKKDISLIIKSLESKIKNCESLYANTTYLVRFIIMDLEMHHASNEHDQMQLQYYKKLQSCLKMGNSHTLNPDNLKLMAYFSALFCAETLGLPLPTANANGNLFLTFLEIIVGFDKMKKDEADIRNILSQIYQKYVNYKQESKEIIILNSKLLELVINNPGCMETLNFVNKEFRTQLLPLNLKLGFKIKIRSKE